MSINMSQLETTQDGLLNRRIMLEQPREGYRVAIDTVFLAAAVPAEAGQQILELGAGVGGAMLCLAARLPDIKITGIEIQPELVTIAHRNFKQNKVQDHLTIHLGDVGGDIPHIPAQTFDHVMINPPYYDRQRHDVSENQIKKIANSEDAQDLVDWITCAQRALKPHGILTIIHHAAEAVRLQNLLLQYFSSLERLDLLPKENTPAKRVILRAHNKGKGITYCQPLVLHTENGSYSDAAEGVLRHLKSVNFTAA